LTTTTKESRAERCPLCRAAGTVRRFCDDPVRPCFLCGACDLAFVPRRLHLSPADQKRRYDLHRNDPRDEGYRRFLSRLLDPLIPRLPPGAEGLDFGSGPGPALSGLLGERGFRARDYDPFYANDPSALGRTYDFVTCTETVEHFSDPAADWDLLFRLTAGNGWLAVMTLFREPGTPFRDWWYRKDETHVCFYSRETLAWIARRHAAAVEFHGASVALFRR
jgi:hypothetical protein